MTATCAHGVGLDVTCELCQLEEYCELCEGCHLPTLACDAPVPQDARYAPPALMCEWFALCDKPAVGLVHHPIIGDVPTCGCCATKLDLDIKEF